MVGQVRALTAGLLVIGSVVGAVVVAALATASVTERRREIAVLNALGASSIGIGGRFVGKAALTGIGGASAGALVGVAMAQAVATIRSWDMIAHPAVYWIAIAQGVAASVIGAALPVRAALLDAGDTLART